MIWHHYSLDPLILYTRKIFISRLVDIIIVITSAVML